MGTGDHPTSRKVAHRAREAYDPLDVDTVDHVVSLRPSTETDIHWRQGKYAQFRGLAAGHVR